MCGVCRFHHINKSTLCLDPSFRKVPPVEVRALLSLSSTKSEHFCFCCGRKSRALLFFVVDESQEHCCLLCTKVKRVGVVAHDAGAFLLVEHEVKSVPGGRARSQSIAVVAHEVRALLLLGTKPKHCCCWGPSQSIAVVGHEVQSIAGCCARKSRALLVVVLEVKSSAGCCAPSQSNRRGRVRSVPLKTFLCIYIL